MACSAAEGIQRDFFSNPQADHHREGIILNRELQYPSSLDPDELTALCAVSETGDLKTGGNIKTGVHFVPGECSLDADVK